MLIMQNDYEIYLKELRQFLHDWENHIKKLDFIPMIHYKLIGHIKNSLKEELKTCKEEQGADVIPFRKK